MGTAIGSAAMVGWERWEIMGTVGALGGDAGESKAEAITLQSEMNDIFSTHYAGDPQRSAKIGAKRW